MPHIFIQKSNNFSFQRYTYSGHKKRNLIKPMMVVFINRYIGIERLDTNICIWGRRRFPSRSWFTRFAFQNMAKRIRAKNGTFFRYSTIFSEYLSNKSVSACNKKSLCCWRPERQNQENISLFWLDHSKYYDSVYVWGFQNCLCLTKHDIQITDCIWNGRTDYSANAEFLE